MSKVSEVLIRILKAVIIIVMGILVVVSTNFATKLINDSFSDKFFKLDIITLILGVIVIFSKMRHCYKILIILLLSALLRVFWIFSINTMPISDFSSMYENAKILLTGDTSILKGYEYLARFPHLIPMTFYMAGIIKIFPTNSLIVMKILNVVFSTLSVYLLYKLADNFIESEREKLFALLIGAIFPSFITYTSVLCTENIAIPLYLLALIMFYKAKKSEKLSRENFIITGVLLAFGNLFRGVAIVVLIAFTIYIFLCGKKKILNIGCVLFGYLIVTLSISGILLKADLIERPLWKGAEPSTVTLLLKGTNFEHNGMWNIDDAEFIDEHLKDENLSKLCIDKVKERLSSKTPLELVTFYAKKIVEQWKIGDCAGTYWAYSGANIELKSTLSKTFQWIYISVLVLAFFAQFRGKNENNVLLNIILFGFGLLFMIIETQPRYSYIVSWIFILPAVQTIEMIIKYIRREKEHVFKTSSGFKK